MKSKVLGVSIFTITLLYGLLSAILILAVMIAGGNVLYAIIGSIIIILIQFLISPWLTDLSMRLFYKAKFNYELPEYLKSFIEDICQKNNIKYPKIGMIEDGAPNAFTYGRTKRDARIILTKGLFDLLSEDEVKAVVGHELGHVAHMDILVMTAVQVIPLILYAVYEMLANSKDSSDNDESKAKIVGYIAYGLYIISQYIILWLSRTREYYADEFSCEATKNPNDLAEALVKIGFGLSTITSENKVSNRNALGIFDKGASKAMTISSFDENKIDKNRIKNSMKWEMWNPWAKIFELNSTHPLISKRLNAISRLCENYNKTPYIEFNLVKEESYLDDFFIELLISILPLISLIISIICGFAFKDQLFRVIGIGLLVTMFLSFIKFKRAHKNNYKESTVEKLLSEIKVSHVTSIPTILKGTIIGRGNPGCIFSEDFVIKDETGIMFMDYNQPLTILNKIFAIFKAKENFDKEVIIKGWYRRSPVPYVEIYEYTIDGKTKKIWTYSLSIGFYVVSFIAALVLIGISFM